MAEPLVATINNTKWPADTVERRPVKSLLPYARNARTHSTEQIKQIAASIREWGFTVPVLVDTVGSIIAGHGRVLAAQSLGLTDVPTMVADGWSAEQIRAYRLADNRIALSAGWDDDALKFELAELQDAGFDLGLTGFGEQELMGLLGSTEGLTDPDDVPEAPAEPVTQLGDVWLLGRHRLVCGDATSEVDVSLALAGVRPHLMVTDPPYGVEHNPHWREEAGVSSYGPQAKGLVSNDDRLDWLDAYALFPGDIAYVWHADRHASAVQASIESAGFEIRCQIIWTKPQFIFGRGDYHWQHEPCWYAVRRGKTGHWSGDRKQSTVWNIDSMHVMGGSRGNADNPVTGHSTQKPVECMRRPIENNSSPGQAVYDPFVGSGTTCIAAEMTGRACHMLEISPTYCDTAILRWQNFTGGTATHATTGEPFPLREAATTEAGTERLSAD
jgi:DNA modification methylase